MSITELFLVTNVLTHVVPYSVKDNAGIRLVTSLTTLFATRFCDGEIFSVGTVGQTERMK